MPRASMLPREPARAKSLLSGGLLVIVTALVSVGLVWMGSGVPRPASGPGSPGSGLSGLLQPQTVDVAHVPVVVEAVKLLCAALIGGIVSAVHRRHPGDKPLSRSLAQAQVLLCVAGALMMIIIGDSLARALGIAGGATIIRFRTPVEDPKDSTVLFLLLGLGVACGMGQFAVAGVAMAFLCLFLVLLDLIVERKPQTMLLEMVADGAEFPTEYVNRLLAAYRIRFEPRAVGHGAKPTSLYLCLIDPDTPLQRLTEQLLDTDAGGVRKVAWETPRKS